MAEWLKAHAWKACKRETVSRVRIPLSPPFLKDLAQPRIFIKIYWSSYGRQYMKKFFILIILNLSFFSVLNAKQFKTNLQCDIELNGKFLATKTFPLDSSKNDGYLDYVDDSIVEFHESIPMDSSNDKWTILYYHIDRFSGTGRVDVSNQINAKQLIKHINDEKKKRGIHKRNRHLRLGAGLDKSYSGRAKCSAAKKSF